MRWAEQRHLWTSGKGPEKETLFCLCSRVHLGDGALRSDGRPVSRVPDSRRLGPAFPCLRTWVYGDAWTRLPAQAGGGILISWSGARGARPARQGDWGGRGRQLTLWPELWPLPPPRLFWSGF